MSHAREPGPRGAPAVRIRLRVNGEERDLIAPVNKTLLEVLREDLGLTGTKHGCELGECGTCTVLIGGEPMLSCLVLPVEVEDLPIETVESLATGSEPHPLQRAFAALGASQCGYCTPGIMMSASALLDRIPEPSVDEIKEHLAGNLCRCTGYLQIIEAIQEAAQRMPEREASGDPPTSAAANSVPQPHEEPAAR